MEATLFTGWIYDHLLPYAAELKLAHPEMLKAITAAKKIPELPGQRSCKDEKTGSREPGLQCNQP